MTFLNIVITLAPLPFFPFRQLPGAQRRAADDDVSDFFEKDIFPLRLAPSVEEIEGPAGHFVTPGR